MCVDVDTVSCKFSLCSTASSSSDLPRDLPQPHRFRKPFRAHSPKPISGYPRGIISTLSGDRSSEKKTAAHVVCGRSRQAKQSMMAGLTTPWNAVHWARRTGTLMLPHGCSAMRGYTVTRRCWLGKQSAKTRLVTAARGAMTTSCGICHWVLVHGMHGLCMAIGRTGHC